MKRFTMLMMTLFAMNAQAGLPEGLAPSDGSYNPYEARVRSTQIASSFEIENSSGKCERTMNRLRSLFSQIQELGLFNASLLHEQIREIMAQGPSSPDYQGNEKFYYITMRALTVDGRNTLKQQAALVECQADAELMELMNFASLRISELKK